MKYNLILFCSSLFCLQLNAQNVDFAPVGSKWHYNQFSFNYPYPAEYIVVEVTGEEVFQGQSCRKIEGLTGCGLPNPCRIFTRSDSVFYWSIHSEKFELLYDFTANTGDTWRIDGLYGGPSDGSLNVFVDSLSQRVVSGDTLKVWHVSFSGCYDWGHEIVEKVGNSCFLSPSLCLCENGPCGIRCYSDEKTDLHFVSYPCDTTIFTSVTPGLSFQSPIQVFPNPFLEKITILSNLSTEGAMFSLYDHLGRRFYTLQITAETTDLNASTLPAGMYYWEFSVFGQKIKTGKLWKLEP